MRIAQLAPPFQPIPPPLYGGTERIVSLLTEELVRRGHDVTLFASADSTTSARLIPTADRALWQRADMADAIVNWAISLATAFRRVGGGAFDLAHSHLDILGLPCAALVSTPTVTTLHGRLDLPDLPRLAEEVADVPLISVSNSQRAPLPSARWVATVYNAVDTDQLRFDRHGGDYLVWLGRISPEKGLDRAIRIARRASMPLKIAARMPLANWDDRSTREDWEYYRAVIKPLLDEADAEYVGELGDHEKAHLLARARALIFPIDWPEPFGLAMAEALACGTPVVARRRASVPEIISHGVTGLLGDTDDELASLCREVDAIERAACRAEAVRRFSVQVMVDGYEAAYRSLLEETVAKHVTLDGKVCKSDTRA